VASFGAFPLDARQLAYDAVVCSANKGLQAPPGLAWVIAKKTALEATKGNAPSLTLDFWDQDQHLDRTGMFRFTPATHLLLDIAEALREHAEVEGLLRLVAQSIGGIQNTHPLGGPSRSGSPEFLQLLAELRVLQEGGALRVRIQRERPRADRVYFVLEPGRSPRLRQSADRIYRMLSLDPAAREFEVIYGEGSGNMRVRAIPVLTRSLLAVLYAVAAEIELPDRDIAERRASPTLREPTHPPPPITIRSGPSEPARSYTAIRIDDTWYWVDDNDFQSKLAFTILELLRSVAESSRGPSPPVLTIPTG
jgi:hypothetical protein